MTAPDRRDLWRPARGRAGRPAALLWAAPSRTASCRRCTGAVRQAPRAPGTRRGAPALAGYARSWRPVCAPLGVSVSPYFLVAPPLPGTRTAHILRSDTAPDAGLRRLNPGGWEPDEWDDLLAGTLGPWAMALAGGRVVSICHTPVVMTARAAESGVWTHPDSTARGTPGRSRAPGRPSSGPTAGPSSTAPAPGTRRRCASPPACSSAPSVASGASPAPGEARAIHATHSASAPKGSPPAPGPPRRRGRPSGAGCARSPPR